MAEALHRTRCALHPSREAAGRCTSCQRFYCRECVTAHEGRLQCARCLELAAAGVAAARPSWSAAARIATRLVCGVVAAWLFFLVASELLVAIPKGPIPQEPPAQDVDQNAVDQTLSGGDE